MIVRQLVLIVARRWAGERSCHSVVEEDVRLIVAIWYEPVRRKMVARVVKECVQLVDDISRFLGKTRVMFWQDQCQRNVLRLIFAFTNIVETDCQQVRQYSVDKKCLAFETCAFLAIGAVEGGMATKSTCNELN
jgi:hypothetical protein